MQIDNRLFVERPFLVLPGWLNSDEVHWQTIWEKRFGWKRVVQADWNLPKKDDWTPMIIKAVQEHPIPPVLICHSLGCTALAHAVKLRPDLKIAGAFLVAPPNLDQSQVPKEILDFRPTPLVRLPFPSILLVSTNDPYCDVAHSNLLAAAWGSHLEWVGERDHIGSGAHLGAWEEGQKFLADFLEGSSLKIS